MAPWELLYFLVWRDVKVRYKQTAIGAGWAILQPLITMVLFTAVFSGMAKIPSDGVPYPIVRLCGAVPLELFRPGAEPGRQQSREQFRPYDEGLFPASAHSALGGRVAARRFRGGLALLLALDGLVRSDADLGILAMPLFLVLCVCHSTCRVAVAVGALREVS